MSGIAIIPDIDDFLWKKKKLNPSLFIILSLKFNKT